MANIESIKTSIEKENNGVWVEFSMGIQLKIARASNPNYKELLRDFMEPKRKDRREDKLNLEDLATLFIEIRAKTILLDWKNIEDTKGKPILYSSEKAMEFFKDPELRDFYDFVVVVSESADHYKKDLIKDSEKN